MIPKIIHYCWFGTKKMSKLEIDCIESWKSKMPEYQFFMWNESNFDVSVNKYVQQAFENRKFAFVSDYCRLKALHDFGGIYLDTDVLVLKSYDDLLSDNRLVFGMEDSNVISTACILAKPNNEFVRQLLIDYDKLLFVRNHELDLTPNTKRITEKIENDFQLTLNNKSFFKNEEITILPQELFSPKIFGTNKSLSIKDSYCIHLFNASWVPASVKIKERIARNIPKFLYSFYYKIFK